MIGRNAGVIRLGREGGPVGQPMPLVPLPQVRDPKAMMRMRAGAAAATPGGATTCLSSGRRSVNCSRVLVRAIDRFN
jgi:hypothetical protein